ncbi:MAG: type II toxin-antitoxin system VapC family toxin [Gemmatimonadota bacterium]|nr:type II toxin-antitoxin system VapC family toxin [Gemmatimonadota bacterium]
MRFWDASAIVPLLVEEPRSEAVDHALGTDPEMIVWWGTPVECASGLARLERAGHMNPDAVETALDVLRRLERASYEIGPSTGLRDVAVGLLRVHDLRAADALQLAAALEWSGRPASGEFMTFDRRLAQAARREGFQVTDVYAG